MNTNDTYAKFKGTGYILEPLEKVKETDKVEVYEGKLMSRRTSGIIDIIPLTIFSDRIPDCEYIDKPVYVSGDIKTRNIKDDDGVSHLKISIRVTEFKIIDSVEDDDENNVFISGYLCKDAKYRKTPLGKDICDVLLAVNNRYYNSSYIPTIIWNKDAIECGNLKQGEQLEVIGRFQSRDYIKNDETFTAYEVSVYSIIK